MTLNEKLKEKVIGQSHAIDQITPIIDVYEAALAPPDRPAGVFMLLGPTGVGKTHTVESIAEALHGSARNVLRIDCGEYQMEHEIAKLIGAPPGYLGHRETHPVITQERLSGITSDNSGLSVVLFDEIEKAAPSLWQILLGVFDKASLRLGNNTGVNFERTLIFLTSNIGSGEISRLSRTGGFGFIRSPADPRKVSMRALRKHFSPEFINRLDAIITYGHLSQDTISKIVNLEIAKLNRLIEYRLGMNCYTVTLTPSARKYLVECGHSQEYGARELKRLIQKEIVVGLVHDPPNPGDTAYISAVNGKLKIDSGLKISTRKRGVA